MAQKNFKIGRLLTFLLLSSALGVEAEMNSVPLNNSFKGLPPKLAMVETSETKELKNIGEKALAFLLAKDYSHLDEFANTLRLSKEKLPNGFWKLGSCYSGLVPQRKAPEADWQSRLAALRDWVAAEPKSVSAPTALAYFLKD